MQQQEKEFLAGYEMKPWSFSPRIYKIIAVSAMLNIFSLLVLSQTNLLTVKGCESPFVGSVCQVLDAVYAGSTLLNSDSEFVSKEYQKTELEDADITYIDVSRDTPPLNYPAGYFALANPEKFVAPPEAITAVNGGFGNQPFGGFQTFQTPPPASGGSSNLLASKPNLPPVNANPIIGDLPSSINGAPSVPYAKIPSRKFPKYTAPKLPKMVNQSPATLPVFNDETMAQNNSGKGGKAKPSPSPTPTATPITSEKVAGVEINKKPFEDLGDTLNEKLEKKEIDLTKPFLVVLDAAITADGKFDADKKKSRYIRVDGDKEMSDVAKLALEAVGNSGILGHLKNNGIDRVNITLVQDDDNISAIILSDQKTPEKAKTTASGFNMLLQGLIFADNNGITKLDDNSKTLVANSKVTNDGKNFVLNFAIPKQQGQELIDKSLKQRAAKKNNPASNGLSQNANQNIAK